MQQSQKISAEFQQVTILLIKTLRWLLDLGREFMVDYDTSNEHATGVTILDWVSPELLSHKDQSAQ